MELEQHPRNLPTFPVTSISLPSKSSLTKGGQLAEAICLKKGVSPERARGRGWPTQITLALGIISFVILQANSGGGRAMVKTSIKGSLSTQKDTQKEIVHPLLAWRLCSTSYSFCTPEFTIFLIHNFLLCNIE